MIQSMVEEKFTSQQTIQVINRKLTSNSDLFMANSEVEIHWKNIKKGSH